MDSVGLQAPRVATAQVGTDLEEAVSDPGTLPTSGLRGPVSNRVSVRPAGLWGHSGVSLALGSPPPGGFER